MKLGRRDFLKYCIGSAAALGLEASVLGTLEKTLAAGSGPPIIWLNGANCTGCTVSLANLFSTTHPTDIADLLINPINMVDLVFHPNLMGAAGDLAVQTLLKATSGSYVLAVDGGIPTAFGGQACIVWRDSQAGQDVTALQAVQQLAPNATAVLCIGACASFGGISGANPNPTQIKSVGAAVTGLNTINIPGCPPHPDWIVWTIAQLLAGVTPALDSLGRPTAIYGNTVHNVCPRGLNPNWAMHFGVDGLCTNPLGCKGRQTMGDCPTRLWNNKTNWCVGANGLCIGCTQDTFPDGFSPFYSSIGATPPGHTTETQSCSTCHGSSIPSGGD